MDMDKLQRLEQTVTDTTPALLDVTLRLVYADAAGYTAAMLALVCVLRWLQSEYRRLNASDGVDAIGPLALGVVVAVVALMCFQSAASRFISPQWYALHLILQLAN